MTDPLTARVVKFVNIADCCSRCWPSRFALSIGMPGGRWPRPPATIDAPVARTVSVTFDTLGVPHIRAANLEDALFAQGYCTAQERIFQMDLLRRFNAGELAEVFGPQALESDRESRRLRLRRIAENAYMTMPAADRAAFAAYTRGVNHYLATHREQLPVEFRLVRLSAAPVECRRFAADLSAHVPQPDARHFATSS